MNNSRIEQLRKQLEGQRFVKEKVDGRGNYHWTNRAYGLASLGFSGVCYLVNPTIGIFSTPLAIDGFGDLVTGQHHFITYHLLKIHPKYEIERLEKEIMLEMIE